MMACKDTNLKNTLGYEQGANWGCVCVCVLKAFQQYQESGLGGHCGLQHLNVTTQYKQWVCHIVAFAIYIKKYLKAKEELWKLKYFTINHLQKNPLKQTKILQNVINL
jgi:hypothetical protein